MPSATEERIELKPKSSNLKIQNQKNQVVPYFEPPEPCSSKTSFSDPEQSVLPIGQRRRILYIYTDPESMKSFDWALKNIFNEGKDYVTIVSTVVYEPSNNILEPKKLWNLTAGDEDGVDVEIKIKKDLEAIETNLDLLRNDLSSHQIMSQKILLNENDPRAKILETIEQTKPRLVVIGYSSANTISRTLFGSLDDYLVKHSPCSVFVIKP